MTRRILLDDTTPGTATQTTYAYERAPCPRRMLAIHNCYRIRPVEPVSPAGPFFYTVRRWCWIKGETGDVGVVEGATAVEAIEKAREVASDDWERQQADPSPVWWQGAVRVP